MKPGELYANPMVGRTGLGNMLFSWARAEVFSRTQGARILAPQWVNMCRLGPWLRQERDKRYYLSSFSNAGYIKGLHRQFVLHAVEHAGETEFSERPRGGDEGGARVVDFKGMDGFFAPFLSEQAYVKERLYSIASQAIQKHVERIPDQPFIGVHIRRGDFQGGGLAISDDWYVRAIDRAVRSTSKGNGVFPVRVFSDAAPGALRFLTDVFPNAEIMPKAPALLDLLLLSRCRALVGTSRSTFSMWAGFLGQMPSFWHPCEIPPPFSVSSKATVTVIDQSADQI